MSARASASAARLREKFSRMFSVPLELVQVTNWGVDNYRVHCPSRPDLPKWETGETP